MKKVLKIAWYRILLVLALAVPAVLCQERFPLVAVSQWASWSEVIYPLFLSWQTPIVDTPSRVAIVEVDKKTIETYGWPLDRSLYVKLIQKLADSGRPWVLSLLRFQEQRDAKGNVSREAQAQQKSLAAAIKRYDRWIGTGLTIEPGAELTPVQENQLLRRVLISSKRKIPSDLPYLPLRLGEDPSIMTAQKAFGPGSRFGTEPVINCTPMLLEDKNHTGAFVLPSALIWSAAYGTAAKIQTLSRAVWPRVGDSQPFPIKQKLSVAYKHCLSSPTIDTRSFLEQRQIKTYSMADLIKSPHKAAATLKDKIVILASDDMRAFQGPGSQNSQGINNAIVPEHLLAARFLDDVLSGAAIQRSETSPHDSGAYAPLIVAAVLLLASFFVSAGWLSLMSLSLLVTALAYSTSQLIASTYFIPMSMLAALTGMTLTTGSLHIFLFYHRVRRQIRLTTILRERLSQCNTLGEVEAAALHCARTEFKGATLSFRDYDRSIYEASSDPQTALALIAQGSERVAPSFGPGHLAQAVHTHFNRLPGKHFALTSKNLDIRVAIDSRNGGGRLGSMRIHLSYLPHEDGDVAALVEIMRIEVAQHWGRVKLLAEQKLLDFRFLAEKTRGEVMERFLTHALIAKFSDTKTAQQNLATVLTPRLARATLFQADIRGYSKISATMKPLDMVKLLQTYYSKTVDAAQMIAQVKLIGDCIFFFIEDDISTPQNSSVDMALELAALLVSETQKQNAKREAKGLETMHFGIGIHYGEVVTGNLSSDNCIDYTVIGPNVNMVARLEELTKNPAIGTRLGPNSLLMTDAAYEALRKHRNHPCMDLDLTALGIAVRSFAEIKHLHGFSAGNILQATAPQIFTTQLETAS